MPVPLGDPARHFFMTRSVARVMGLNLTEAMKTGSLNPAGYERMVTRCRRCALVDACQEWLSSRTTLAGTPPPGCNISTELSALRGHH